MLREKIEPTCKRLGGLAPHLLPTRLDVESNPRDVRQKLAEKKIIFLMQTPDETKASQKIFDEIFRPR